MITHDITERFDLAVKHIVSGTLVKDEQFSLFEAVGALEIGEPKMDSGCLEPGQTLEDNFDLSKSLLPEELIWTMDQLLNREVAWLMGYPLSQTLFTSVHIDRLLWPNPKSLDNSTFDRTRSNQLASPAVSIFRAYCLLLIKACDLALAMVQSQHYYEEEDFTTQLFHRELLHRFQPEEISEIGFQALEQVGNLDTDDQKREAIHVRLNFRLDVLETMMQHTSGNTPPDSFFALVHDYLDKQQATHAYGMPLEGAFSTKLQRRLASTVPPRPMVTVSMDEAWNFWRQMLDDCQHVFAVHSVEHSQNFLTAYKLFAYSDPQPSTYPRALLQSFLTLDGLVMGRLEPLHLLEEDIRSLTLPATQLLTTSTSFGKLYNGNEKVQAAMHRFIDSSEQTFLNVYRAFCLNSCRIRRTLCHALAEWDKAQVEVEDIDTIVQQELRQSPIQHAPADEPVYPYSLSSWVFHHKLEFLRLIVQMGFEQTIYGPQELAGTHWYLSSICGVHLAHLERISQFITIKEDDFKASSARPEVKTQAAAECAFALHRLFRQYALVKATHLLATTLHAIFVVLQRYGIFVCSGPLYSSDDLRYEIRMKPFLNLTIPETVPPEAFAQQAAMTHVSTHDLLEQAGRCAAEAKKAWEEMAKTRWYVAAQMEERDEYAVLDSKWSEDIKGSLKAAIAAGLCVLTLKKAENNAEWKVKAQKETRIPIAGEKAHWHRWWSVPLLPAV